MKFEVRQFKPEDKQEILSMMNTFYSSEAVSTNGSFEIFEKDFDACLMNDLLSGYVFTFENNILGYSMIAKSFSTEFGKNCYWFEDFYIKPEYRGRHIIPRFIEYIKQIYPDAVFKLEAETTNTLAIHVYEKCGFKELPYKIYYS